MRRFIALFAFGLGLGGNWLRADVTSSPSDLLSAAKPLALDICFAETDYLFREIVDESSGESVPVITDNFYAHSTRVKIDVAETDVGKVAMPEHVDVTYRIAPAGTGLHVVTVLLDFHLAGRRDLSKTLELPLDRWVVHTLLSYKTRWGDQRYYYAVVRLGRSGVRTPLAREN